MLTSQKSQSLGTVLLEQGLLRSEQLNQALAEQQRSGGLLGKLLVKMLYNEKETDFKAACDGAKKAGTAHYYDYAALKSCYGRVVR